MKVIYSKEGRNREGEKVEVYVTCFRAPGTWYGGRGIRYIYEVQSYIAGFPFDRTGSERITNKRKAISTANSMFKHAKTVSFKKDIEPHIPKKWRL